MSNIFVPLNSKYKSIKSKTFVFHVYPQGDSGGPLTVVNEEGSHILVGIVSKSLEESCSQQDYTVFTSVSALKQWIESLIKENGGMASCGIDFSALPTLGIYLNPNVHKINK